MKKLSPFIFHLSPPKGFTLAELVVIIAIALTMIVLSTIALARSQQKASLTGVVDTFVADLKEQQAKAMVGDTEGTSTISDYGLDFETTQYTLFRNTYVVGGSSNFVVSLPPTIQVTGSQIIFAKGSGETTAAIITFTDTTTNEQRTVTMNKYGVITGVN